MIKRPLVSIIIPFWNGSRYLKEALDSVLKQKETGIEIIAIDDGSTDNSLRIVEFYSYSLPIRIVRRPRLGNWVANTNIALKLAKGKYATFLHQDDIWLPGRLEKLKELAKTYPNVDLFLFPSLFINSIGKRLGILRCPLPSGGKPSSSAFILKRLCVQNFIAVSAPFFRLDKAHELGRMDERLWYTADWKFWIKLVENGTTIYDAHAFSGFRIHPSSLTTSSTKCLPLVEKQLLTVSEDCRAIFAKKGWDGFPADMAILSLKTNCFLAAFSGGQRVSAKPLLNHLFSMSPFEILNYFRYSRILERILPRLKVAIFGSALN